MKSLDYFYEEILTPIYKAFAELVVDFLEGLLIIVFLVTVPLWIVPYLIIRHKRNKTKGE